MPTLSNVHNTNIILKEYIHKVRVHVTRPLPDLSHPVVDKTIPSSLAGCHGSKDQHNKRPSYFPSSCTLVLSVPDIWNVISRQMSIKPQRGLDSTTCSSRGWTLLKQVIGLGLSSYPIKMGCGVIVLELLSTKRHPHPEGTQHR